MEGSRLGCLSPWALTPSGTADLPAPHSSRQAGGGCAPHILSESRDGGFGANTLIGVLLGRAVIVFHE
jgi:hypothetical protein